MTLGTLITVLPATKLPFASAVITEDLFLAIVRSNKL
jgi:hypothetical protein